MESWRCKHCEDQRPTHTLYKVVVVLAINQVVNLIAFELGAVEKAAKAVCLFAEEETRAVRRVWQQRECLLLLAQQLEMLLLEADGLGAGECSAAALQKASDLLTKPSSRVVIDLDGVVGEDGQH